MPDDATLVLLDQRLLPEREVYLEYREFEAAAVAITDMVVRGAPAIGITAAYAMVLAARGVATERDWLGAMQRVAQRLKVARPTAVNLAWAVDRCMESCRVIADRSAADRVALLADAARTIHKEDVLANRELGRMGAERVPDGAVILTHCNAGALATGGYGTALGVVRAARDAGKTVRVLADETRPYLQGARLTAWELSRDGIPVDVIIDSSSASLFARSEIDLVIVGADRIAANGDVANKIGTYGVACLARIHERPFYVAAPWSTLDVRCPSGAAIPIEQRPTSEVTHFGDQRLTPDGVRARNPAFDVTPARLVTAIFTERGVIQPVGSERIAELTSA
jgi:methylthioribose-1-phosphate isomerase